MNDHDKDLRAHLSRLLDWEDAHAGFDAAVKSMGPALRGVAPTGHPHSPWQILEHLRLVQFDILDFCRRPAYVWPSSKADYWPPSAAPPGAQLRGHRHWPPLSGECYPLSTKPWEFQEAASAYLCLPISPA